MHSENEGSACVHRAWKSHISLHPNPPHNSITSLAQVFVSKVYLPDKEQETLAVLLLALHAAPNKKTFVQGRWISHVNTERYLYLHNASGWGDVTTLRLVEKFVRWAASELRLTEWQLDRLLFKVDDARESHGIERRTESRAFDRTASEMRSVSALAIEFAKTVGDEFEKMMVPSVVETIAASVEGSTASSRVAGWLGVGFAAVDEFECVAMFTCLDPAESKQDHDAQRFFMVMAARFYQWLGHEGLIAAHRAEDVSQIFFRAATQSITISEAS